MSLINRIAEVVVRTIHPHAADNRILDLGRIHLDGSTYLVVSSDKVDVSRCPFVRVDFSTWAGGAETVCSVSLAPDEFRRVSLGGPSIVERLLFPKVPAKYVPQAWVRDNAINVDDGAFEFDALPAICQMEFPELLEALSGSGDWDGLCAGQPGAEAHTGPFEVYPDLSRLHQLFRFYWLGEYQGSFSADFTQERWDAFRMRVNAVLEPMRKNVADIPVHLGHGFMLEKAIEGGAVWKREMSDEAIGQTVTITSASADGEQLAAFFEATIELDAEWFDPGQLLKETVGPMLSVTNLTRQVLRAAEKQLDAFAAEHATDLDPRLCAEREGVC
jgi:hypothetical protein